MSDSAAAALARRLAARIAREGPISLAGYMAEVLAHPSQGYYSRQDPFGATGDFVTAPEISQMFGELIGLWCVDSWQRLGSPASLQLIELGPGRGTLLVDALRAAALVPAFGAAVQIHLVEISPTLRALQRERLADLNVTWHDNLGEVPEAPSVLIANEFFDALPVRQFERTDGGWAERVVALAEPWHPEKDGTPRFAFALAAPNPMIDRLLPKSVAGAPCGALVEICPSGISLASEIGRRLTAQGGAALIVDYGHAESRTGASLQALRRHAPQDVLEAPGSADLTAHVDFAALSRAAGESGARSFGPVTQADFLQTLGIETRSARLKARATPPQAEEIDSALRRLTGADQMGALFKVLGLANSGIGELAGF